MSKEEVITFLEDQGYTVQHLQGWEFHLTKMHKSIFNDGTAFTSEYTYNVKTGEISTVSNKKNNGLEIAKTKAQMLSGKNPKLQSVFSRGKDKKEGLVKGLRVNASRKEKN